MSLLAELRAAFAPIVAGYEPDPARAATLLSMIRPATSSAHGDYQANLCMPLAKQLGRKPNELAAEIAAKLPTSGLIASATPAGGFINLSLAAQPLADSLRAVLANPNLGVTKAAKPKNVVIDYSGPNVAKPLHVGHLRSTVIGDSLKRILNALGHHAVGDNHLGDWGFQFGILIYGYKHYLDAAAFERDPVRELARLYVLINGRFQKPGDDDAAGDDPLRAACRAETAKLHAGDPENVALWQKFMPSCLAMLAPIYSRLGVTLEHTYGESFYHPMLPGVVSELLEKGLAREMNGAVVIPNAKGDYPPPPPPGEKSKEEPPAIIRNRDGAYNYTTSDLATVKFRAEEMKVDTALYVVDARQAMHFRTVFAAAKRWGYDRTEFVHVMFGSILGPDGKPIKSRDGNVYELEALLDEAVSGAGAAIVAARAERAAFGHAVAELSPQQIRERAEVIGVGTVKYTDLSGHRTSDYTFDLKRMLAPDGNTATYMLYAYARCRGIQRKSGEAAFGAAPVTLDHPAERALVLALLRYPDALESAGAELAPHLLVSYLWDAGKAFSVFNDTCPVLQAETPGLRASRLTLVEATARTLKTCLNLLGVETVEQM